MSVKRELIDRQELYEILCHDDRHGLYVDHVDGYEDCLFFGGCGNDFLNIMNKAITVDAVEVVRGRWQRFLRGYSYGDVWDMDFWFIHTVKPMLIHLREHSYSIPAEFENNERGWHDVLSNMISCLDMMDQTKVYKFLGFGDFGERINITLEDHKHVDDIMEANKNRFFELFSKYFYNLWD